MAEPTTHSGADPEAAPDDRREDERSDLEQIVAARSDAIDNGEGGPEPEPFTAPGLHVGVGGTGGEVRNQDADQQ